MSGVRAVFFDRDGVLNRAIVREGRPFPPRDLCELEIIPEAPACLLELRERGFLNIVVTNQPDVGRGVQTRGVVEELNHAVQAALALDRIMVCYHDATDGCDCRKPKPGLLIAAARELGIDLECSFMVGDRWRDVDAGAQAGCRTVLIDYGYRERAPDATPSAVVRSLREAVDWILTVAAPPR